MAVIAIDGPAGAGKSTVAKELARRLRWLYVDTGAMYRAVAALALERGVDLGDAEALERLARAVEVDPTSGRVLVAGHDIARRLRDPLVTRSVSSVSAAPEVRTALLEQQRRVARRGNVVIEGRDIGTTVVPEAALKVFLTASLHARAERRARELALDEAAIPALEKEIAARDKADAERASSPLARPNDALLIDSTSRDVGSVVDEILAAVQDDLCGT
jgi:cytidylate kinase